MNKCDDCNKAIETKEDELSAFDTDRCKKCADKLQETLNEFNEPSL